jgi:Terminase large subunit, T4likevirus-type, N-terminal
VDLTPEEIARAAKRLKALERRVVFDPFRPGSRATVFQQTIIDDFGRIRVQHAIAGNRSGKTQMGARLMAWMLAEDKPGWTRPEKWGYGPLQFMMIGRVSKHVEEVLYRKVRAFFEEGELHETRVGNALQKVTHRKTGNVLLCASHHNSLEAREKIQAYELCGLWIDEMPADWRILEEADRRLQDRHGFLFTSFTPKVRNLEIRRKVDAVQAPKGKHYKMKMFDNPIYSDEDKADILASLEGMPEAYKNCVLNGDWMEGDTTVYQVPDGAWRDCPDYSPTWRHVECADPALQSKHGQVVFAEDPRSGHWWVVREDYVEGIFVPEDLVRAVTNKVKDLTVVRRVCDPASTWYIGQASKMGFQYVCPWDKNNRRAEMMKNFQAALGVTLFFAPWIEKLPHELGNMQWSETAADKIVNQHSYHLHDATIYGVDCLPKREQAAPIPELHVRLRIKEERDRKAAAAPKQAASSNRFLQPYKITRRNRRGLL